MFGYIYAVRHAVRLLPPCQMAGPSYGKRTAQEQWVCMVAALPQVGSGHTANVRHKGRKMARTLRDAKLDTRSARLRLAVRREPYWRSISDGLAIGYRKGAKGGTWIARHYTPEAGRRFNAIGTADDVADADGVHVLTFGQAQEAARTWFAALARQDRN